MLPSPPMFTLFFVSSLSVLANLLSSPPCPPPPALFLCPRSAGIAVGFYGNGETCDGVNRLTYALRHANHTIAGVQKLVRLSARMFNNS